MAAGDAFAPGTLPVDCNSLFAQLPTAFVVMDTELVIVEANQSLEKLVGRHRQEILGRPVFEAFPPPQDALDDRGRNPVQLSLERARDTGRLDSMPIAKYDVLDPVDGGLVERYWSLISAPVLDSDGRTVLVVLRAEDVSAYVRERSGRSPAAHSQNGHREVEAVEADLFARLQELRNAQEARDMAARRLSSLAEVALALTTAETVEDLERIVVSRGLAVLGADGGGIISPHDRGGWRATLSDALGEDVQLAYGHVPYDSPLPAPWVARTGREMLLPTRESGLAFDRESMAAVYADIGRYGWAFLPLTVNDACVGSLAVAWADEHPFASDELQLLRVFAAQCAQVLVRIRATAAQRAAAAAAQRMSETLQRSLLTQPPTPNSLEIAVRYEPASKGAHIGGDWYDAFGTVSGATTLVIGDVTGHDGTAAATMGQLRNLVRGMAYDSDDSPAVLLSRLDDAMSALQVGALATALLGRVEQYGAAEDRTWRLRWSNAGHPPPLLRHPSGTVQILDARPELLLGLDPRAPRSERVVELVSGSTLLFYSDGLVERRTADLDEGIARLVDALMRYGDLDPEDLCSRLLVDMGLDTSDDDIALLALRPRGGPPGLRVPAVRARR